MKLFKQNSISTSICTNLRIIIPNIRIWIGVIIPIIHIWIIVFILSQYCVLLYKYDLRHAKWKGFFLSLQRVLT